MTNRIDFNENRAEQTEQLPVPGRRIHLASLANIVGIILFYIYYRYMNPDPVVSQFWKSTLSANILFFVLAVVPFIVIGFINRSKNRSMTQTIKKGRENWTNDDISELLDYIFQQPRIYFLFSFFAWTFEGALWGCISWLWGEKAFGESFLITFLGTVVSGSVAAMIAFIIADKIARQEVLELFPQLEATDRPIRFSMRTIGLAIFCVVGVMPVLIISYLSTFHAEHALLSRDLSRLTDLRNTNLAMVGLSIFLTVMAIGWITRSITKPLIDMAELVKKVSMRDFSSHMPVLTDDEIGYVSGGLNLMVKELAVLYQSLERKVEERTKELHIALDEVETANKKIVDSISYSKRIQHSLLPDISAIQHFLPHSFFIWLPRDVVGGDIYYAERFEDGFIITVIDCTGHGIPGALMTMVAASALRRIIIDESCRNPAEILKRLNINIKQLLHQDRDSALSDDGLDASICFVNTNNKQLTFAGARLTLTYILNNHSITVKGDRHSIGYKKSNLDFEFTNHTIDLQDGMGFYMYTDGIVDQLGGPKRLPFGNKRLSQVILDNHLQPFSEQGTVINRAFEAYRGENEIQDDITVVGFRI